MHAPLVVLGGGPGGYAAAFLAAPLATSAQPGGHSGAYHIFPMTSFSSPFKQPPAGDMNYYGGSVFSTL